MDTRSYQTNKSSWVYEVERENIEKDVDPIVMSIIKYRRSLRLQRHFIYFENLPIKEFPKMFSVVCEFIFS